MPRLPSTLGVGDESPRYPPPSQSPPSGTTEAAHPEAASPFLPTLAAALASSQSVNAAPLLHSRELSAVFPGAVEESWPGAGEADGKMAMPISVPAKGSIRWANKCSIELPLSLEKCC